MIKLDSNDNTRLLGILMPLPCMADENSRRGAFIRANLAELLTHVTFSGTPATAVPLILHHLCTFGEVADNEKALGRFLNTLKTDIGKSEQKFFDDLIRKYHLLPATESSPDENFSGGKTDSGNLQPEVENNNSPNSGRQAEPQASFKPGKAFSLTIDLQRKAITSDGLYQEFFDMNRSVVRGIEKLIERSRRISNRQELEHSVEDVELDFIEQVNWLEVWRNYIDELARKGQSPCFIFNTPDRELLDFPIELARDRGECISLTTPMYKEVLGFKRPRLYYPFQGCFAQNLKKVNLLFVASSFEGKHRNRFYDLLPLADEEVSELCHLWLKADAPGFPHIGRILVLSNDSPVYTSVLKDARVSVIPATLANLERALRGDSGEIFHLFHYSGHYLYGVDEARAGFLLFNQGNVEFFNLARLKNALSPELRMVYLSACGSAQHQEQGNFLGAAYTCLKSGVPVVIGMRWPLSDSASKTISQYFYQKLISWQGIPEIALWKTRTALESQEGPSGILWAAPLMLTC